MSLQKASASMASELVCGIGVASAEQLGHGVSGNVCVYINFKMDWVRQPCPVNVVGIAISELVIGLFFLPTVCSQLKVAVHTCRSVVGSKNGRVNHLTDSCGALTRVPTSRESNVINTSGAAG